MASSPDKLLGIGLQGVLPGQVRKLGDQTPRQPPRSENSIQPEQSISNRGSTLSVTMEECRKYSNVTIFDWEDFVKLQFWRHTPNPLHTTEEEVTAFTARKIQKYVSCKLVDGVLLEHFQSDFEDWTDDTFELIAKPFRRELKNILRQGGLYTGFLRAPLAKSLAKMLDNEEPPKWNEKEARNQDFQYKSVMAPYGKGKVGRASMSTKSLSIAPSLGNQPQISTPSPSEQAERLTERHDPIVSNWAKAQSKAAPPSSLTNLHDDPLRSNKHAGPSPKLFRVSEAEKTPSLVKYMEGLHITKPTAAPLTTPPAYIWGGAVQPPSESQMSDGFGNGLRAPISKSAHFPAADDPYDSGSSDHQPGDPPPKLPPRNPRRPSDNKPCDGNSNKITRNSEAPDHLFGSKKNTQGPPPPPFARRNEPFGPPSPEDGWGGGYGSAPMNGGIGPTTPSLFLEDPILYIILPPANVLNEPIEPKLMSEFVKAWDKANNYTGDQYCLLKPKMTIFFNICYHIQVRRANFHALFPRMLTERALTFYMKHVKMSFTFRQAYLAIKDEFESEENRLKFHSEWTSFKYQDFKDQNPGKPLSEVIQIMIDKMQLTQDALADEKTGSAYAGDDALRDRILTACKGAQELKYALIHAPNTSSGLVKMLMKSVDDFKTYDSDIHLIAEQDESCDQMYTDRTYGGSGRNRGFPGRGHGSFQPRGSGFDRGYSGGCTRDRNQHPKQGRGRGTSAFFRRGNRTGLDSDRANKRCFVCQTPGCWSTNHTPEERAASRKQFLAHCILQPDDVDAYIMEFEGLSQEPQENEVEIEAEGGDLQYWTADFWLADNVTHCENAAAYLQDQAFLHSVTGEDVFCAQSASQAPEYALRINKYSEDRLRGAIPDTGAARVSTGGLAQYKALNRERPELVMTTATAGQAKITFGHGVANSSVGSVDFPSPFGSITFHILDTTTPFLFGIADMDRLGVYLNNVTDELIQGDLKVPVIRKWGHPWFLLNPLEQACSFLTEQELRIIHRRWGHKGAMKMYQTLEKAGYENVSMEVLKMIEKFCHHCQLHSNAPQRFKFSLKDDREFNYEILIDVMYLNSKPVLHAVDEASGFNAAHFLPSLSAKDTWEILRKMWIDTYIGPPDVIRHDTGTNFASKEFRSDAKIMGIHCEQVPVEAHHSIGKLERLHGPLRRAFEIMWAELGNFTSKEAILQMSVKACNDTAGPDGLVPTLVVFGAYPRLTLESPPSPSTARRAEAVRKTMAELRKITANRKVRDALNTRNGPVTTEVISLPLQSEVRVFREDGAWHGPYRLVAITGHNLTVDLPSGPTDFRSTSVRAYHRPADEDEPAVQEDHTVLPAREPPLTRKRGRPLGSKNKTTAAAQNATIFLSAKEKADHELALKLRMDGINKTPGAPFEKSDMDEFEALLLQNVFTFETYDKDKHGNLRIFPSRLVREIKGKTSVPYEKSRLVIQGYLDAGKELILTQSPTIQKASHRLILALAPSLIKQGMQLELRDITQAYLQSQTSLQRAIYCQIPQELRHLFPNGTIMKVMKALYGLAESGVHWWVTYNTHHREKLDMSMSTYDPCLLITNGNADEFGVTGMQVDDTLNVCTQAFSKKEDDELEKAGFKAKPKTKLSPDSLIDFSGSTITMNPDDSIRMTPKGQGSKLKLVDPEAPDRAQQYVEQRARGAYIASLCQPEALFDLSTAAQIQGPDEEQCVKLNERLEWQIVRQNHGLNNVPIDLSKAKLFAFTDGSFANNEDLSSQLGFTVILATEVRSNGLFKLKGNMITGVSVKCKRVTRSVLASETYGFVIGFDFALAIVTTLHMICDRLGIPRIPLILCTDSYSLYECLVKLSTTNEKRLMIDLMALRQSYERREISEIRWIHGDDNPADAFTKNNPNPSMGKFVATNELTVRVEGFVDRPVGH